MTPMPWPKLAQELLLVLVYDTVIGLFLTAVSSYDLATNLLYSQCIGLSIYACVRGSCLWSRQASPDLIHAALGIPVGAVIGFALATWARGDTLAFVLAHHQQGMVISAATALFFGVLAVWHFHDQARLLEAQAEARAERLRRSEQQALATRTELALLQAQIEPHFLFNTLSNVVGLVDADPAAARRMLIDLTALLRVSLARTRRTEVTLDEELELLRAYLAIMAVRMGGRLDWRIDADDAALAARLPPLLVQPLVENAIRHGIEPMPTGGRLAVRCHRQGDGLVIEVDNDGAVFAPGADDGVGLTNVRERLRACYDDGAALELEAHDGGGLMARIRLPFEDHVPAPDHR